MARFATRYLTRSAWFLVLRGLLGVSLAVTTLFARRLSLHHRLEIVAGYAAVDGAVTLIAASSAFVHGIKMWREGQRELALLIEGLLGLTTGALAFLRPVTVPSLIRMIAARATFTGAIELKAFTELRGQPGPVLLLGLAGFSSLGFGFLLATNVAPTLPALLWEVRIYGAIYGASLIALGLRFRGFARSPTVRPCPT